MTIINCDVWQAGVFLHLATDAFSSIAIALTAAVMHFSTSPHRFIADPVVGLLVAILTGVLCIPQIKETTKVLLFYNSIPDGNKGMVAALLQLPHVMRVDSLKVLLFVAC